MKYPTDKCYFCHKELHSPRGIGESWCPDIYCYDKYGYHIIGNLNTVQVKYKDYILHFTDKETIVFNEGRMYTYIDSEYDINITIDNYANVLDRLEKLQAFK